MKKSALFLLCGLALAASSEAANILFVSIHPADNAPSALAITAGFTQAPDIGYTQLLQANGHTVTRVLSSDTPAAAVLNAADLVIISRSVPSGHYELDAETAAWNGITAPTIILGGYVLRNNRLGYTTGTTIPDTAGTVKLRALVPNHPIFAGISLDASKLMVNPYAHLASYTNTPQRGISVNSNPLSGGGVRLAAIGTPGDPTAGGTVIAEWLRGDVMATSGNGSTNDFLGGHRLVLLTGSRENAAIAGGAGALTADAAGIYDLDPDGAQLLLNAVNYMTSSRIAIRSVDTVNNVSPGPNETSLMEALTGLQDGDFIRFKIPGAGPHVITTPLGGYPLITANGITIDGYTQAGSVPNANPILGGNNAQIKIVLDSTGADTAPSDPQDPALLARRSTRILHSGYGDSENGILAVLAGDNFTVRGLSFIARRSAGSTDDPAIYAVALVNQATNARVQGCWFGLAPGGSTMADVKPVSSAVAGFRYRTGGDVYSEGCIVGTDGDGVNDRAEFNVIVGGRIPMALELPRATIAGNYVNVFPDGLHFVDLDDNYQQWRDAFTAGGSDPEDVTVENYENGRVTEGSVIGTNGDGVSDSDERNVFGHTVYGTHGEFYSSSVNAVLAGNYFGVGVDGITPAPLSTNIAPGFVEFGGSGQVRVGSNGDGISDDLEGNLIVNVPGTRFVDAGSSVAIVSRRNKLVNCGFSAVPFAEGENAAYSSYYATYLADANAGVAPVLGRLTNGILSGTIPAPGAAYPNAEFDIYRVDPVALGSTNFWPRPVTHPMTLLGTYTDNGPGDLNPNANEFSIDVSAFALSDTTYVSAAASYSAIPNLFNATNAVTSPMSNPISTRPVLRMSKSTTVIQLSWIAPEGLYEAEKNEIVGPTGWFPVLEPPSNTGGRNVVDYFYDPFAEMEFFRLTTP